MLLFLVVVAIICAALYRWVSRELAIGVLLLAALIVVLSFAGFVDLH